MATWDVKIPKSRTPRFPPICVGCGGEPTTTVKLQQDAIGWWSVVRFGSIYGAATGRRVDVPACDACARRLRRERYKREAAQWAIAIAAVALGLWLFREWDGMLKRFAIIGLVLAVAIPYVVWEQFFPPTVDITVTDDNVTFHFADRAYADQFATENGIL